MSDHTSARPSRQFLARRKPDRMGALRRLVLFGRNRIISLRLWYLREMCKMDIGHGAKISLRANLDRTNPRGVHVGENTYIAFHAVVFAHDMCRLIHTDTYIGQNCFVGAHAIIMPGVRVGDQCIVGAGAVVTKDVPSHSIVAGNPARVIRSGIRTIRWGILEDLYSIVVSESSDTQADGT